MNDDTVTYIVVAAGALFLLSRLTAKKVVVEDARPDPNARVGRPQERGYGNRFSSIAGELVATTYNSENDPYVPSQSMKQEELQEVSKMIIPGRGKGFGMPHGNQYLPPQLYKRN